MISSVTGKLNITLVHIIYNNNWVFKTLSLTLHRISPGIFTYLDIYENKKIHKHIQHSEHHASLRNLNIQPSWIQITQ